MAYTLIDQVQDMGTYEKGIIRAIYEDMAGGRNNILKYLPVGKVGTLVSNFLVESDEGPTTGVGSRPFMGAYPEGTATHTQRGFTVGNVGGRAAIDEAYLIQKGYAEDPEAYQLRQKSKLLNRTVNNGVVNGDRAADTNFFDGLKKWVSSKQVLTTAETGWGGATLDIDASAANQRLALQAIDLLLDRVGGSEHENVYLICNRQTIRQIRKAVRELGWFGTNGAYYDTKVMSYGNVKFIDPGSKTATLLPQDAENNTNAILPNNLASSSCDIYAVRMGLEDGLGLYELRPIHTRIIERLEAAPVKVIEVDWYVGLFPKRDDCIAKVSGLIVV